MKTRFVIVIAVWAALAVGVVTLFEAAAVPLAGATVLAGAAFAGRALLGKRSRRRAQPWAVAGEPQFPPGPRRVLLSETGLALSQSRSRSRA